MSTQKFVQVKSPNTNPLVEAAKKQVEDYKVKLGIVPRVPLARVDESQVAFPPFEGGISNRRRSSDEAVKMMDSSPSLEYGESPVVNHIVIGADMTPQIGYMAAFRRGFMEGIVVFSLFAIFLMWAAVISEIVNQLADLLDLFACSVMDWWKGTISNRRSWYIRRGRSPPPNVSSIHDNFVSGPLPTVGPLTSAQHTELRVRRRDVENERNDDMMPQMSGPARTIDEDMFGNHPHRHFALGMPVAGPAAYDRRVLPWHGRHFTDASTAKCQMAPPHGMVRDLDEEKSEEPAPKIAKVIATSSADIVGDLTGCLSVMTCEIGNCLTEMSETFPAANELREPLLAYTLAALSLVRDPSPATLVLEVGKLLNHTSVSPLNLMRDSLMERIRTIVVPQSDAASFAGVSVHSDALAKAAYDIFSSVSIVGVLRILGFVDAGMHWKVVNLLRGLVPKDDADSFLVKIIAFMRTLLARLLECARAGSFAPLLQPKMTFEEWHGLAHTALWHPYIRVEASRAAFLDAKKKGEIQPYFTRQYTGHERVDLYKGLAGMAPMYMVAGGGGVQPSSEIGAHVTAKKMRDDLTKAWVSLELTLKASQVRPEPFALHMQSVGGVGKSMLISECVGIVADTMEIDDRQEIRYDFAKTKHMDGVSSSKVVFVMDDKDQNAVSSPTLSDTTWCEMVIGICNNTPFMAVMADVESKGQIYLRPRMFLFASNRKPNVVDVERLGANAGAVFRRFQYYLKLRVAKASDATATGTLRKGVALHDGSWVHEIYEVDTNFDFENKNTNKGEFLKRTKVFDSRIKFLAWVRKEYQEWYDVACQRSDKTAQEMTKAEKCVACGMRASSHVGGGMNAMCPLYKATLMNHPDAPAKALVETEDLRMEEEVIISDMVPQMATPPGSPRSARSESEYSATPFQRVASEEPAVERTMVLPEEPVKPVRSEVALWIWASSLSWLCAILKAAWDGNFLLLTFMCLATGIAISLIKDKRAQRALMLYGIGGKWLVMLAFLIAGERSSAPGVARSDRLIKGLQANKAWVAAAVLALGAAAMWIKMYLQRMRTVLAHQVQALVPPGAVANLVPVPPSKGFVKVPKLSSTYPADAAVGATSKQILELILACRAEVFTPEGGKTEALYMGDCKWLVNKHLVSQIPQPHVQNRGKAVEKLHPWLDFEVRGVRVRVPLDAYNVKWALQRDIAIVSAPSIPPPAKKGLLEFIAGTSLARLVRFSEGFLFTVDPDGAASVLRADRPTYSHLTFPGLHEASGPFIIEYNIATQNGWCGRPFIVKVQNAFQIVGMHAWSTDMGRQGASEELIRGEIEDLMSQVNAVGVVTNMSVVVSSSALINPRLGGWGSDAELLPLPEVKSAMVQAWQAARNFFPLGTLKGWHNSRMKTKFLQTPIAPHIQKIAEEEGVKLDITLPTFAGEMGEVEVDGEIVTMWKNCVSTNLVQCRNVEGPEEFLRMATDDYVVGLEHVKELFRGVKPLTLYEAMRGDDEKLFNPKDLDTSTGPPFNTQKKSHMKFTPDGGVEVRDTFLDQTMALYNAMLNDPTLVYCPAVKGSKKDEPLSRKKAEGHEERLFFCAEDSFNTLLKMFAGPILVRLAAIPEGEMAIGMNIAGPELDAERARRAVVDPERKREMAADYKKYDKRQSNQVLRHGNDTVYRISAWTSYTEAERSVLRRLLLGMLYSLVILDGDVAVFGFMLLSGLWITAHLNSLINSILYRASYFMRNPEAVIGSFRKVVVLSTLGDDNLASVAEGVDFDQHILRDGVAAYGMELTSCKKEAPLERFTLPADSTFLKRHQFFDGESGRWKAPLAMESILKMLLYTKIPANGIFEDQVAVNVRNALAELFLHGKETYDRVGGAILSGLPEDVAASPFLGRSHYEDFEARFLNCDDIWAVDVHMDNVTVATRCQMLSADSEAPPGGAQAGPQFEMSGEMADVGGGDRAPLAPGAMRDSPLARDEVLFRAVRVASVEIDPTDVYGTAIYSFDPYAVLSANTQIAAKLRNFFSWRGRMVVTMEMSTPSVAYGEYIAMVDPRVNDNADQHYNIYGPDVCQAFQAKNHVLMSPGLGSQYSLEVPWMFPYDRAPIRSGREIGVVNHLVYVHCVVPLSNGLDWTTPVKGYLTIYVRFERDLELYGIVPQMMKASGIMKAAAGVAGALGAVPMLAPYALPISAGLAAGSGIASAMGHTRHQEQKPPVSSVFRSHQPIATADGVDSSAPNALTSMAKVANGVSIGGMTAEVDEMSFEYLFKVPALCNAPVQWTVDDVPNKVLLAIPITPGIMMSTVVGYGSLVPSPAAWAGALCQNWRGTMKHRLHIVAPPMSTGHVVVFWSPDPLVVGDSLTYDPTSSTSSCVFDLAPTTTRVISTGWNEISNVGRMRLGQVEDAFEQREINGYLIVAVANQLVGPQSATAAPAYIFAEQWCGDDMVFGGARTFATPHNSVTAESEFVIATQATLAQRSQVEQECVLTASSNPNLIDLHFAEPILSLRALCQRFAFVTRWTAVPGGTGSTTEMHTLSLAYYPLPVCSETFPITPVWNTPLYYFRAPVPTTTGQGPVPSFNYLGWARAGFLGIRGGMLLKMVPAYNGSPSSTSPLLTPTAVRALRYYGIEFSARSVDDGVNSGILSPSGGLYRSTWGPTQYLVSNGSMSAEFYLPYVGEKLWEYAGGRPKNASDAEQRILVSSSVVNPGCFEILQAGAADISLIGFKYAPRIVGTGGGLDAPVGGGTTGATGAPVVQELQQSETTVVVNNASSLK